jgi:predicted transcriptional regulator
MSISGENAGSIFVGRKETSLKRWDYIANEAAGNSSPVPCKL